MTGTSENIAELFYSKLKGSPNPGVVLAQFYSALIGTEIGRSEIIKFNMLLKTFGRSTVFFAIIDASRVESFSEFPYGLLFKICKDRLEASLGQDLTASSFDSLDKRITETQKEMGRVKSIDPEKALKYLKEDEGVS